MRVPTVSEEDARHLHRTRETIQQDRNRLINGLKGLLTTYGVQLPVNDDFLERIEAVRLWEAHPSLWITLLPFSSMPLRSVRVVERNANRIVRVTGAQRTAPVSRLWPSATAFPRPSR